MITVKDNTKIKFSDLCGGDIFTCTIEGDAVICMKLAYEVRFTIGVINEPAQANATNLLSGELMLIPQTANIQHHNATLELN